MNSTFAHMTAGGVRIAYRDSGPAAGVTAFSCGHSIHRDRHREFCEVVLPFLAGSAAGR